jgi:hypothetical protein
MLIGQVTDPAGHASQRSYAMKARLDAAVAAGICALALLACREKRKATPIPPSPAPVATEATKTTPIGLERGEIQAGTDSAGLARRAIVRVSPGFSATEVTRLENGTAIGIVQHMSGGWLHVRWPYPSGTNAGYVHKDVVSLGAGSSASRGPVAGGPCTSAQESTTSSCRCADGKSSTMVCLGRSLTWSACNCSQRPAAMPTIQPDQKGFCQKDSDCRAPYRCGFQGNCMLL